MKVKYLFPCTLVLALLWFTTPQNVYSHPGNTASDSCHYCRTRCDYWGVPWNQRHCHGENSSPSINIYVSPTLKPTNTPRPTNTPTPKPKPTLTPTPTTTPPSSVIKEEIKELSPTPEVKVLGTETTKESSIFEKLLGYAIILGSIIFIIKERRNKKLQI